MSDIDPDLTWVCGGCSTVLPAALPCRTCRTVGLAVVGCNDCPWTETVADETSAHEVAGSHHETTAHHVGTWVVREGVAA